MTRSKPPRRDTLVSAPPSMFTAVPSAPEPVDASLWDDGEGTMSHEATTQWRRPHYDATMVLPAVEDSGEIEIDIEVEAAISSAEEERAIDPPQDEDPVELPVRSSRWALYVAAAVAGTATGVGVWATFVY